jgi:hypothetical protein
LPNIDARVTPAPDSLQFNLKDFSNKDCLKLMGLVRSRGVQLHILGLENGNARVFWNWKFLTYTPYLPKTKKILFRACDLRVPIQFSESKISKIADIIIKSIYEIKK